MTHRDTGPTRAALPAVWVFALSYALLIYFKGWHASLYTLAVGVLVWVLYLCLHRHPRLRCGLAYMVFFFTPLLTASGQIGVLTGFGGSNVSLPWLGVSFVCAALAAHILQAQLTWRTLWLHILQPLRFNSGPCALPCPDHHGKHDSALRSGLRRGRVWHYLRWLVLGAFFYGVLAAALAPLLVLKQSDDALDILCFAIIFEAYVYFNFSGICFMVYGALSLAGVQTVPNFATPFAARDVIGYWQRWHVSLSSVLKMLFFTPIKARLGPRFGLPIAVVTVFICSALWHGVSLNFVLWGGFHAFGWLLTYAIAQYFARLGPGWIIWAKWINGINFPIIIVIGRLIFSEADSAILLHKFQQLAYFETSQQAWCLNLVLDWKTGALVCAAAAYLLAEALFTRRLRAYKFLRRPWVSALLLILCLWLGNTGLGGVYGAR
jgi:alginate O-acetyltransferase complex protein AlgI